MLQQLINLSPDIKKLSDEGYELELCDGHLLVHHIPYVNSAKEIKYGTLICVLTLAGPYRTGKPQDHTIYFDGEPPCNVDGSLLSAIINNSIRRQLTVKILVTHYFSSKPASGKYDNYYDKVRTYSEILSAQAIAIDNTVTSKPNKQKAA